MISSHQAGVLGVTDQLWQFLFGHLCTGRIGQRPPCGPKALGSGHRGPIIGWDVPWVFDREIDYTIGKLGPATRVRT